MTATAAEAAAPAGLLGPLRARNFRLLWAAGGASALADQLSLVALAWLALQLTGSPLTVGAVLTAAAVPRGALMLLGGAVADRLGGRTLAVLTSLLRVAAMGLLALLVVTQAVRLWEVIALSLVFGVADAFYGPARGSLLPRTVSSDQLDAANSLAGVTQSLASLLGPPLAGLLIARAGTGYALAGDAICFALVSLATAALRLSPLPAETAAASNLLGDLVAGLRYVFADPLLRSLLVVAGALNFAASGPVEVGLAALARSRLGGAAGLGVMLGAFGAGSLVGALVAGARPGGRVALRLYGAGIVAGLLIALLGVVPDLGAAVAVIAVIGVIAGTINVGLSAWLMRRTDPRMMGRVVGILSLMTMGLVPFSLAAAGALAQFSVSLMFAGAGALMVLAGLLGFSARQQVADQG